ncbi:MAG: hypothetical protein EZS28_027326 [Streblomastix strix]|uniref:Uncharacterized protein n=1 Tax=Streblomastix strix TaxID=222440 RepID=A0A5J4V345_9EUKA|nr:MAG: hypothetical protein EZS28_027326 [Streblomastix strix]
MQPRPQRGGRAPHIVEFRIVYFGVLHRFIFDVRHVTHFCKNVTAPCQNNNPNQMAQSPTIHSVGLSFIDTVWVRSVLF